MAKKVNWKEVRELYEGGTESVSELARSMDLSASIIYRHIREEKWKRPEALQAEPVPNRILSAKQETREILRVLNDISNRIRCEIRCADSQPLPKGTLESYARAMRIVAETRLLCREKLEPRDLARISVEREKIAAKQKEAAADNTLQVVFSKEMEELAH